jgi:hypothetical protein
MYKGKNKKIDFVFTLVLALKEKVKQSYNILMEAQGAEDK